MKIGITQIILGNVTLAETLSLCREAGYECVELTFRPGKDLDPDMSADEIREVGATCREAGVGVTSVIASYADNGDLLSQDPEQREKRQRVLARSLEIANLLGANVTLLHPGQLTAAGTYEQVWDNLVGTLKELVPVAKSSKCAIAVENVWNKFLLSPKEAREFVDAVGSQWVGIYLDTANMMAYGYPEHWIRGLGKRIKKVHFKDFKRREHQFVPLMEGDTDWPTVMRELRSVRYDDAVIHEIGGDRNVQIDMAERMRRIIAMK